ncbi:hypothetical protein OAK43_02585 [Verrucomicrobiales bacterium]|nr:hypothetical protein [Verrucomicrobiales bacterium]
MKMIKFFGKISAIALAVASLTLVSCGDAVDGAKEDAGEVKDTAGEAAAKVGDAAKEAVNDAATKVKDATAK